MRATEVNELLIQSYQPPIPCKINYQCTFIEWDLGLPIGYGETPEEALEDFIENFELVYDFKPEYKTYLKIRLNHSGSNRAYFRIKELIKDAYSMKANFRGRTLEINGKIEFSKIDSIKQILKSLGCTKIVIG